MEALLQDLKYGIRLLFKDKGYTATMVLTLGLCIGANTTVFSVVDAVVLSPLPFPDSERILRLYNSYPGLGVERGGTSPLQYFDRVREITGLAEQALYKPRDLSIGLQGMPERIPGMAVTPSFFPLLGIGPHLGRTFTAEEGELGNHLRVVLSYGLWQQLYGGDREVLGRDLRIDGEPHTVIGVMPGDFLFLESEARLWTPLTFPAEQMVEEARHDNNWQMLGRLRPDQSGEQVQAQVDALNAADLERSSMFREMLSDSGFHTRVVELRADVIRDIAPRLYMLWGAVVFVLLIGCVNIANLVLVRASARSKELATRAALGASRRRIPLQLLVESIVLTLVGGVAGLVFGSVGVAAMRTFGLDQIPRGAEIGIDASVVAATLGLAVLIGAVLGLIPIVSFNRLDLRSVLYEQTRGGTSGRGVRTLRRTLVVAQVASALILLIGTGLLVASFRNILNVDPGFDPQQLLTAAVEQPAARYRDDQVAAFAERAVNEIGALPGVVAVGAGSLIPFGHTYNAATVVAEGRVVEPGETFIAPTRGFVTPGYFEALGIPLREGRLFDLRDTAQSAPVAIVDERLARIFWPQQSALGKRLLMPTKAEDLSSPPADGDWITIVGVVGEARFRSLVADQDPVGAYFLPFAQESRRSVCFAIRTATDPLSLAAGVRSQIAKIDPELPLFGVRTMTDRMSDSLASRRSPMLLLTFYGVLALCLSMVGIYGVLAYLVTQRTREFGIRMALGCTGQRIFQLVLNEGLLILAVGLAIGLAGAWALGKTLESKLYGVALEPSVLVLAVVVLILTTLCACLIPAWRASRIDPLLALCYE
ncbi:MAG: ABC transporter permease [bacterium]|nr:ABC transporter permease [bacterium]